MGIEIDKAKKEDVLAAIELLKELYLELGEEAESIKFVNEHLINELSQNGKTEVFLARSADKKIIGIFTLTESQAIYAGGTYGVLDEMYIKPDFRSAGIGKEFIKKIKSLAKEKKWKRVDVTAPTEERWKRTVKFYEDCGFVFTGPKLKLLIP